MENVEAVVLKLRDGDVLLCKLPDGVSPEQRIALGNHLRRAVDITERKNVAIMCVSHDVEIDVLHGDKTMAALRAEIDELKATVAKYVHPPR